MKTSSLWTILPRYIEYNAGDWCCEVLLGESHQRQTKHLKQLCQKAKKSWAEGETRWEGGREHLSACREKTQRWGVMMEHSWTARPTCDRVLYYYGDFSVALCFAPTVKTEQREIEKEKYHKLRENSQQREQSCYFLNSEKLQAQSAHCATRN